MKRKLALIITVSLFLFAPLSFGTTAAIPSHSDVKVDQLPTEVTVGFLTPQTGALSTYSPGFENGALLAAKHLNESTSHSWIINFHDTQTTPEGASAAMTAAINDGSVYVVGAAGSSNTLSAASLAKTNQIPLISYASTSPDLSGFDDDGYLWRVVPSDAFQGQADAQIALDGGFRNAYVLHVDNAYGIGIADQFETSFQDGGGNVIAKIPYNDETKTDFSSEINQIEADQPDLIFAVSYATDGSLLFTQLDTQEVDIQVLGTDGIADNGIFAERDGTQEAMDGYVATKPTSIETTATQDFASAYQSEYGTAPPIFSAEAYDAVTAGATAAMNADSTSGPDIIAELANLNYEGASGRVQFDSNGDVLGAAYQVLQVQGTDGWLPVGLWDNGDLSYNQTFADQWVQEPAGDDGGIPFSTVGLFAGIAVIALISRKRKDLI